MKKPFLNHITFLALLFAFAGCNLPSGNDRAVVTSPGENIRVGFLLNDAGRPGYSVEYNNEIVIDTSFFGFSFRGIAPLKDGFIIENITKSTFDETWEMPWGEQRLVHNRYNEMLITLAEDDGLERRMHIRFKVYDDGLGFRFEFPGHKDLEELIIMDEHTQFNLTGDHLTWWIPGDWDIYEHLYNTTPFTQIDALSKRNHPNLAQTYIPENAVNTPVTMRTAGGLHLSFHEANLTDYAGMTLRVDAQNLMMESELVGSDRFGYKVKRSLPFETPWRTIQIAETAAGLIESNLIVNLNEPNKLGDVSWFKPMKYAGIWWDMHIGTKTWAYAGGKHGATTEYAKEMIDFAARNNIGGVLVEGWNTGWEHWIGFEDREGVFDFVTPYPDYDLNEVARYAKENDVQIVMHHETSSAVTTYDQQMDTAYRLMQSLGMNSVKTGYVGKIIPKGEYHHGQWMVNHYRRALETAAKYNIAINAHEPIKATGIRRMLPNAVSREGLRGQEFNAWATDGGNPPEHLPVVAFTRMLAGPIDYTPGIFNIMLDPYKPDNRVNTTLAHQLALYVVIYSPVQMVPDLIKYYEGHPAFQFIRDVAVDWETTKVLNGEVGDFVTIARRERGGNNWYVGAITDETPRQMSVSLDFLEPDTKYTATIYKDGPDADWKNNPIDYAIETIEVDSSSTLQLQLAAGGGAAISLMKVQ
jgi:glucan 1,4-alpha-glucosidase